MKVIPLVLALFVLAFSASAQTETPKPKPAEPAATQETKPAAPAQTPPADKAAPKDKDAAADKGAAAGAAPATASSSFTAEQLEQIVAPIALHPDALLAQMLMASTYPLEIVEAHRWVQKNPKVTGKSLEDALKKQDWDPSVKALCMLPSVLKQMNDNLDWTQDLGDAFLGQKAEVMETVQKMRRKSIDAGNLKSTEQQKISKDGDIVIIESTKTETVYVPTYSPTVVYGGWSYPYYYYPPMYPPAPTGGLLFAFSVGVAWGNGCWGGCNWHGGDVNIDIDRYNNFNRNTNINPQNFNGNRGAGNKGSWNHSPEHRKGTNYKNPQVAQKYGASAGSNRVTKDQARGYDRASASTRPSGGSSRTPSAKAAARPSTGAKPNAGAAPRPSSGAAPRANAGAAPRPSTGAGASARPSTGASSLSGSRSPSMDRSASSRGASSRSGGGGGRGGGGRGGGGRR
jgi:uncharacterized membrane protein YgcG